MQRDTRLAWQLVGSIEDLSPQKQDGKVGLTRVKVGNLVRRRRGYDPVPKNQVQYNVDFEPEVSLEVTATHIVPRVVGNTRVAHKMDMGSFYARYDKGKRAYQASPIWVHSSYPRKEVGEKLLGEAIRVVGNQKIIPPKKKRHE